MAFSGQTFSVGQILTASTMNQMQTNIDEVRTHHQSTAAPAELAQGVVWLDTSTAGAWELKLRDDAGDWITLFTIDNSANTAAAAGSASGDAYGEQPQTNAGATGLEFVGPLLAMRNMLINGQLDVWQRGVSFSAVANATKTADRFGWKQVGSGSVDISRDSSTTPDTQAAYCMLVDVQTADGAIAASDVYAIWSAVEGQFFKRAKWGSSSARSVTLSFWVRSNKTGTYCVAFRNAALNRSYIAEYVISASNTWERKTITIAGDTSGTWADDTDEGVIVTWCLGGGADFQAAAGAWAAGNDLCSSSQENCLDSSSNAFRLALAQLEIGGARSPFELRPFAVEHLMCQRYYWKSFPYETAPATQQGLDGAYPARLTNGAGRGCWIFYPSVPMRVAPTTTSYNPVNNNANASSNLGNDRVIGSGAGIEHKSTRGWDVRTNTDDAARSQDNSYLHATLDAEYTVQ